MIPGFPLIAASFKQHCGGSCAAHWDSRPVTLALVKPLQALCSADVAGMGTCASVRCPARSRRPRFGCRAQCRLGTHGSRSHLEHKEVILNQPYCLCWFSCSSFYMLTNSLSMFLLVSVKFTTLHKDPVARPYFCADIPDWENKKHIFNISCRAGDVKQDKPILFISHDAKISTDAATSRPFFFKVENLSVRQAKHRLPFILPLQETSTCFAGRTNSFTGGGKKSRKSKKIFLAWRGGQRANKEGEGKEDRKGGQPQR